MLFLDADDFLRPECISTAVAEMKSTDVKLQFQLATIDQDGTDQDMIFPYFSPMMSSDSVHRQALASAWYPWTVSSGNLFARWYLEELFPLNTEIVFRSPDSYLNKLAPLYGAVRTLRRVLGAYRVHGRNAWASSPKSWDHMVAVRWLRFDRMLEGEFLDCAARKGIVTRRPLLPIFHQLEYRALALRFTAERPIPGDSRASVLLDGMRWLVHSHPDGVIGSVARIVWLFFVVIAPKKVVEDQIRKARAQSHRSRFWKQALRLSRLR